MITKKMKALVEGGSAIRAMFEEGKKMIAERGAENVFDFSLGNPSIVPPKSVKESIIDIVNTEPEMELHGYMNNSGYEDVREAIAEFTNKSYGTNFTKANIVMTVGAAGGINVTFKTLVDDGDEIICIAPYFGEYNSYISNANGVRVVVSPDTETFSINFKELEEKISPKTKFVIINSPNNPTGAVYSEEDIKKLASILEKKQTEYGTEIYIFSDEPYREIAFNNTEVPYVTKYYNNTIVGYSYSKSLSLPGERIGYLVVPSEIADFEDVMSGLNVATRILGFVNAPSLMQKVVARNLGKTADLAIYEENEKLLYNALVEMGYEIVEPKGTFYMFPKSPIADDKQFCADAKEFGLVLVPGSNFGCPEHFRIAFCVDKEKIEASLPSFKKAIEKYK